MPLGLITLLLLWADLTDLNVAAGQRLTFHAISVGTHHLSTRLPQSVTRFEILDGPLVGATLVVTHSGEGLRSWGVTATIAGSECSLIRPSTGWNWTTRRSPHRSSCLETTMVIDQPDPEKVATWPDLIEFQQWSGTIIDFSDAAGAALCEAHERSSN